MDMPVAVNANAAKQKVFRHLRSKEYLREFISEVSLTTSDLCHPVFIRDDISGPMEVENMPSVFYYPLKLAIDEIKQVRDMGVKHFVIRPRPSKEIVVDPEKSIAFEAQTISAIAREIPDVTKIVDGYFGMARPSGWYGSVSQSGDVEWEKSLEELAAHAVAQGEAGADIVVSLGRLDGGVAAMREALNDAGLWRVGILAYSVNFASTLAHAMLDGTDMARNSYKQTLSSKIGVGNIREALRQVQQEVQEGVDILGVKPATIFMDAIAELKRRYQMPIATYIVSKEYCMVKAAAQNGWIDEKATVLEYMLSMKRAGADRIFNYWVKDLVKWIKE